MLVSVLVTVKLVSKRVSQRLQTAPKSQKCTLHRCIHVLKCKGDGSSSQMPQRHGQHFPKKCIFFGGGIPVAVEDHVRLSSHGDWKDNVLCAGMARLLFSFRLYLRLNSFLRRCIKLVYNDGHSAVITDVL